MVQWKHGYVFWSPFTFLIDRQEYLYQLASSMREIAGHVEDEHLFRLEESVRLLEVSEEQEDTQRGGEGLAQQKEKGKSIVDGAASAWSFLNETMSERFAKYRL